jgi:molybdopterin-guanine dinucleotide biosynthesis protein A
MGGGNKLYLEFEGSLLLEKTLNAIAWLFNEVVLIVAKGDGAYVSKRLSRLLARWNVRVAEDERQGIGPLEGLRAGLSVMKEEWGFLLGCDMPSPMEDVINCMRRFCGRGADAVVAECGGYIEPLHAFYGRACASAAERAITRGDRKVKQFYDDVRLTIVREELFKNYRGYENSFLNLNTPRDIERLRSVIDK